MFLLTRCEGLLCVGKGQSECQGEFQEEDMSVLLAVG